MQLNDRTRQVDWTQGTTYGDVLHRLRHAGWLIPRT
ncbi:hypothetical protein BJ973_004767 [Actinoplanes tereljensis]